jgi:hypothetical protein
MLVVFALALFMSAALLFWIQPLVGKLLLPPLGGTPAVWNTCMLFFQFMLLAGYGYALIAARKISIRAQVIIQVILLLLALMLLPISISSAHIEWLSGGNPIFRLLGVLFMTVGLPFFILSTHGPLLQNWFAHTRHSSAKDPYFLYAASNLGSFIALIAFPFFLEPNLALGFQNRLWALGYCAMIVLIAVCAPSAWRAVTATLISESSHDREKEPDPEPIATKRRLSWLALAFIPSSLMMGTTLYISTDIAAVPLLWVIPLAIYLITFVLAFARTQLGLFERIARMFPGAALILTYVYVSGAAHPVLFLIFLHLAFFFMAAMLCHGQLARSRPSARHLVEYYFWLALGGMAGGLFNALFAPVVFNRVIEYPIAIVLACVAFRYPGQKPESHRPTWTTLAFPAGIFLLTVVLALAIRNSSIAPGQKIGLILGIPIFLSYMLRQQPYSLGLSVIAVMLGSLFYSGTGLHAIHVERNFFGVLRVTANADGTQHQLYNGDTVHGKQFEAAQRRCEPLAYYHRAGPLGEIMEAFNANTASSHVAVIGLGTGAMAAFAKPGQEWTFYEINPAVLQIAQTPGYFTYLSNCSGAPVQTVLGDARIKLQQAKGGHYTMIVLDAFSSDAVPTHLITRDAMQLYFSKVAPGGMMAFHISNRSLDLSRVLAGLAASEGLTGYYYNDRVHDAANGKDPSSWAIMARNDGDLHGLASGPHWKPLKTVPRPVVWRDDFSNILHVLKW